MKNSPLDNLAIRYLVTLLLLLSGSWAFAQPAAKPPVYVLVHGAWHGGW